MFPHLFGINNFSYTFCFILGIVIAFVIAIMFLKKKGCKREGFIDLLICGCFGIAFGIIFSILFENLYELIEKGANYSWTWGMTFFGGLFGGVLGFLLTYFLMRKNINFEIRDVLKIAPICITIAHCFGRIGCSLAGCCYGKPTDSWIGITISGVGKVIPTQLFEAIFLALLFGVLLFIHLKFDFRYNFVVYLSSYAIFRFIIEFFRGDPRGVNFFLSPSQIWCIILLLGTVPLYLLLKRIYEKE